MGVAFVSAYFLIEKKSNQSLLLHGRKPGYSFPVLSFPLWCKTGNLPRASSFRKKKIETISLFILFMENGKMPGEDTELGKAE